jgi:quinol monooxygenase YgiN/catechol 2,3-dioxygenase-like lactoylglutathione lyase family enzyme
MHRKIKHISLIVNDYDKAIDFYTQKLDFNLIEDTKLSENKRWVLISPKGNSDFSLLIAKASNEIQKATVGNQSGGRVFLFMNTDDFDRDYNRFKKKGIEFVREPKTEPYGKVAVFRDLYGNLWDLIEPVTSSENHFNSTGIIELKDGIRIKAAKEELKKLALKTKNEFGNITFDVQQLTENQNRFIIWESFKDEKAFNTHLNSVHFKEFSDKQMFEFIKGYTAEKI